MSDEAQLQARPKDRGSSLTLSKVRSSLIARGRRDAAILAGQPSREPADPLSETRRLAEHGDADAQCTLGDRYYYGEGVRQDHAEAVKWYREAAEQGDPDDTGDPERLGAYYEARHFLANFFPRDYVEIESEAAEQGQAESQYGLAWAYRRGVVIPQDYAKAVNWYRRAAEQGHAGAQYELGDVYHHGEGVLQDYAEAAKWYRKAAEQGHADAQYNLGVLCCRAQGVPPDYVQAHMWMDLAASAATGDDRNTYSSGRDAVDDKMTPQQIAEAQRLRRDRESK